MKLLIAICLGVAWGGWIGVAPLAALAAAAAVALLGRSARRLRGPTALLAVGLVAAVWGHEAAPSPRLLGPTAGPQRVEGRVADAWCREPGRCAFRLEDATSGGHALAERLTVYLARGNTPPTPGQHVAARGLLLANSRNNNPGVGFPTAYRTLRWRLVEAEVLTAWGHGLLPVARASLRSRLTLPDETATQLYRALLLGDRQDLDHGMQQAFRDTGTAHLLAISGLHLALVGWGIYRVILALLLAVPRIAQVRRTPAIAAAITLFASWGYAILVARTDATFRATIVLTVVLVGQLIARRTVPVRAIGLAASLILLADPRAWATASFQLSFCATLALVLAQPLARAVAAYLADPGRLTPLARRVARPLVSVGLATTVTFAATAPLTLAWFGQLAVVGLLVNLVAVPLTALVVVPIGFVWLIAACVAPPLADALADVPVVASDALTGLVDGWAGVAGPATSGAGWSHLAGLIGAAAVLCFIARRWRVALAAAALALGLGLSFGARAAGELTVTFLDVGHGDAAVVQLPDGGTMMVDTGGSWRGDAANQRVARYTVLPALARLGIDHLDVLAITHAHPDHVGAASWVVERIGVSELWLPPCGTDDPRMRRLAVRVAQRGGVVRVIGAGPQLDWAGASLQVLWPPLDSVRHDGTCRLGANDASLVIRLDHGGQAVLLTGDIERAAETLLVAERPARLRAAVLKAPHHASRTSSTPAFLRAVAPRVVVVSGRRDVPQSASALRMPPHHEVLERYRRHGIEAWITGLDGAVTVTIGPAGVLAVSGRPSGRVADALERVRPP